MPVAHRVVVCLLLAPCLAIGGELALKTESRLKWQHASQQHVIAELVYADQTSEQRVGQVVDNKYFVSDGETFTGQWLDDQAQFVTPEYANVTRPHAINRRPTSQGDLPTPGGWSAGLGYRGFRQNTGRNAASDVTHRFNLKGQYQLTPEAKDAAERLVLQRDLGFSQLYWQRHVLMAAPPTREAGAINPTLTDGRNEREQMTQIRMGQIFLQPKDKAGREMIGIQSTRNIKPAENFLFFQGRLYSPAQISVLVNEQLRYSNVVNPGQIDLYNVPLESGVNNVRVLVRQLDGRLQEFSSTLNVQGRLLPEGMAESDYSAGVNRKTRQPEAHLSYAQGVNRELTLRGAVSLDEQHQVSGELAHATPWGVAFTKVRVGENKVRERFEAGMRTSHHYGGVEHTRAGWATWFNGRLGPVSLNLKKAISGSFGLGQVSWTRTVGRTAIGSLSCSVLRTDSGQSQKYCGVSVNFLMLQDTPASLSVSKASGVQDGLTVQGALQNRDSRINVLSSPNLDSVTGQFPVAGMDASASADNLGGRSLGLDLTFAGSGRRWLGHGQKSDLESATFLADTETPGATVLFDDRLITGSVATAAALDVRHRMALDPETVPMHVDLDTFTQHAKPRAPGVYLMRFGEAQIEH